MNSSTTRSWHKNNRIYILVLVFTLWSSSTIADVVPKYFRKTILWNNLNQPISLKFAPNGDRFFILEKSGNIYVSTNNSTIHSSDSELTLFVALDAHIPQITAHRLAIHPQFPQEPYLFVSFTAADNDSAIDTLNNNNDTLNNNSDTLNNANDTLNNDTLCTESTENDTLCMQLMRITTDANGENVTRIESTLQLSRELFISDLQFTEDGSLYLSLSPTERHAIHSGQHEYGTENRWC
jgi:hypothetical protein